MTDSGEATSTAGKAKMLVGLSSLGLFLLGVGVLVSLILSRGDWEGVEVLRSQPDQEVNPNEIIVDVAGAVEKPGVYKLPAGSRFGDALSVAGGLAAGADRDWVTKYINLAQNIMDGSKLYIPARAMAGMTPGTETAEAVLGEKVVNVNTASTAELETLWGVGPSRAKAIIDGRPYYALDELVNRRVIPETVWERNRSVLAL